MSEHSFIPAADGWCYLVTDEHGRVDAGFRVALWRVDSAGEVVGMVPVSVPADFKQGQTLPRLATVPALKGRYAYWDDLPAEVQQRIAKG